MKILSIILQAKKRFILVGLVVLVFMTTGLATHFYLRAKSAGQDATQSATAERDALVARVRRIMVLPDEQPEIATVTNPDALKSDPFFIGAKTGDKLLIFSKARRAVLFDPVEGHILNAAPLNLDPTQK